MALTSSKDFFDREGDVVNLARTTVDLVDLLQWLGDNSRALSELAHASEMIAPLVTKRSAKPEAVLTSFLETLEGIRSGKGKEQRIRKIMWPN
jgi:hypothetical protein